MRAINPDGWRDNYGRVTAKEAHFCCFEDRSRREIRTIEFDRPSNPGRITLGILETRFIMINDAAASRNESSPFARFQKSRDCERMMKFEKSEKKNFDGWSEHHLHAHRCFISRLARGSEGKLGIGVIDGIIRKIVSRANCQYTMA